MRSRTRTKRAIINGRIQSSTEIVWTNPDSPPFSAVDTLSLDLGSYDEQYSSMTDFVEPRPEVYVDSVTGRWKRVRNPHTSKVPAFQLTADGSRIVLGSRARREQAFRPVHPCTHQTETLIPRKGINVTIGGVADPGNLVHERAYAYSYGFADGASFLAWAGVPGQDLSDLVGSNPQYSTSEPPEPDWFALADSFNESCDQFIPSKFLLGEDIVQNAIFIDAFKAIVNPTSIIPTFFKVVNRFVKKSRRKTLGQVSRELTKQAADTHLSTIFGVIPAIHDIVDTIHAHRKVSQRLESLHRNAGSFVPVRVRQLLSSDFTNTTPGPLSPGVQWDVFTHLSRFTNEAVAGSWGRVREDFNFGDTWSAYLQYFGINKILGLAWELVPFSFVVDWFTNAQERINTFTRLRTGGPFTEFRGFTCSLKKEKVETLFLRPGYFPSYGFDIVDPSGPIPLLDKKSIVYNRFTEFPDTSGVIDLGTLGLFQFSAGASLLLQRLLR